MQRLPQKVLHALDEQKRAQRRALAVKRINGRYYLYREWGSWDWRNKRERIVTEYLGRITEDGRFVKKKRRLKRQKTGNGVGSQGIKGLDSGGRAILTALSMNARMSTAKLAGLTGMHAQTAYHKARELEGQLGIRYILEVDVEKLGYTRYLLLVKFAGTRPRRERLAEALATDPRIQFAALTEGDYDLVLYLIDKGYIEAIDNMWEMRSHGILGKHSARWHLLPFGQTFSFMPLRDEFLEQVLKPKELGRDVSDKEMAVLKELNANSIESFSEIDIKNGFTKGSARYAYLNLMKRGIIVRPTITVRNASKKHLGIALLETLHGEKVKVGRNRILLDVIEDGPVVDKYAMVGNVGNPAGAVYFLPLSNGNDIRKHAVDLSEKVPGVLIKALRAKEVLVGSLCFRRFDKSYSRQYGLLADQKKLEKIKPVSYLD